MSWEELQKLMDEVERRIEERGEFPQSDLYAFYNSFDASMFWVFKAFMELVGAKRVGFTDDFMVRVLPKE